MTESNKMKNKAEREAEEQRKLRRDSYIFGSKEKFKYGEIRFLTFEEYNLMSDYLGVLGLNVLHVYYQYRKGFEESKSLDEKAESFLDEVKKLSLLDLINSGLGVELKMAYYRILDDLLIIDEENLTLYDEAYEELFGVPPDYDEEGKYIPMKDEDGTVYPKPTLKQLVIELVFLNEELFKDIREKIMDMNVITEDEVSPNPEINAALERSRKYRRAKSKNDQTFVDIVTSIVSSSSNSFEQVAKMNVHQVYGIYQRIAQIKNYDASILYSTVAPDVKIEAWDKHIDLFKEESTAVKKSEFMKKTGGLFS